MRLTQILCSILILMFAGCSPDYYKRSADKQVYQILRDRKYDTVGYNPQAVVGAAAVNDGEGATGGPAMAREEGVGVGPAIVPAPGAGAVAARAYDPIPTTPLPPLDVPPLEMPATSEPWGPLGPWPGQETDGALQPSTRAAASGGAGEGGDVQVANRPRTGNPAASSNTGQAVGKNLSPSRPVTGGRTGRADGGPGDPQSADARGADAGSEAGALSPYESAEVRSSISDPRDLLVLGPPAPGPRPISLDLFGSLAYGVQHSRSYREQMDRLYLSALDVTLQRHLFEPRPFAQLGLNYTGGQSDVQYKSALAATVDAGVRQRLPYGGEIVAETLVSFVRAISDNAENGESARFVLSGSLPLLRGAGLVNLEPLVASERTLIYQVRGFEDFRRQFAVDVATQYFRVLIGLQAVNNRRTNVENLRLLRERTVALYAQAPVGLRGRLGFLEVQRAEQSLLQGQDDLLSAQLQYLNTVDDFKILLGMDVRQPLELNPVALDVALPDTEGRDVVDVATRFRLDVQTARDQIDDARRQVAVAQNGLLPDLNLTAQGQGGNGPVSPLRELNSRSLTYSAGVTLDLPVDRLVERNAYRAALIAYYAARRNYEDLHDRVAADVRTAVRAIRQAQSSVDIQRRSINLALLRLENANILLKLGSINARDVVEAQSSLLTAQDRYDQAQSSLQVQVLTFLRVTGTLRVDPTSGTLGRAMDRSMPSPLEPQLLDLPQAGAGPGVSNPGVTNTAVR